MFEAIVLSREGQLQQAISALMQEAKDCPNDRFININLGILYKTANNKLAACRFLLKGAQKIEQLGGLYKVSDILNLAYQYYNKENYLTALKLFEEIIREVDNVPTWGTLGNIHLYLQDLSKAAKCFNEVLKRSPDSKLAKIKLQDIHDFYFHKADELSQDNQNRTAAEHFDKALDILRLPETLKRAASLHKFLKNNSRSFELMSEYRQVITKEREFKKEQERLELIKMAKESMKKKDFNSAIHNFELAFPMKTDKDVFMYLAHIYKTLNRTKALTLLISQWKTQTEFEEKRNKFDDSA